MNSCYHTSGKHWRADIYWVGSWVLLALLALQQLESTVKPLLWVCLLWLCLGFWHILVCTEPAHSLFSSATLSSATTDNNLLRETNNRVSRSYLGIGEGQTLTDKEPIRCRRGSSCLCPVILPRAEEHQLQSCPSTACSALTTQESVRARESLLPSPSVFKLCHQQTRPCPRVCGPKSHWLSGSKSHYTSPFFSK